MCGLVDLWTIPSARRMAHLSFHHTTITLQHTSPLNNPSIWPCLWPFCRAPESRTPDPPNLTPPPTLAHVCPCCLDDIVLHGHATGGSCKFARTAARRSTRNCPDFAVGRRQFASCLLAVKDIVMAMQAPLRSTSHTCQFLSSKTSSARRTMTWVAPGNICCVRMSCEVT